MLTPRRAEGREFKPRPGHYSRMSFSSDQVTGTVFPHLNMPFHCPRGEAEITVDLDFPLLVLEVASHVKNCHSSPYIIIIIVFGSITRYQVMEAPLMILHV